MSIPTFEPHAVVNDDKFSEYIAGADIYDLAAVHGGYFGSEVEHIVNALMTEVIGISHEHMLAESDGNTYLIVFIVQELIAEILH